MAIKIRDLAKKLEVSNEDILEQLRKLYVDVEDENTKIDEKIAGLIRIKLSSLGKIKKPAEKKSVSPKTKKRVKKKAQELLDGLPATDSGTVQKTKPETIAKVPETQETETLKKSQAGDAEILKKEVEVRKKKPKKETKELDSDKQAEILKSELRVPKTEKAVSPPLGKLAKKKEKVEPVIEIVEKKKQPKSTIRPYIVKPYKKGQRGKPYVKKKVVSEAKPPSARKAVQKVQLEIPVNIRTLAPRISVKPNLIIQYLMGKGAFVNINQDLEEDIVRDIMTNFGYELELPQTVEIMEKELVAEDHQDEKKVLETRAPVVTFMGHVDHGKTSLLDYIRKTMVVKREKGGITQHIGAYKVKTSSGSVTFLDTPGHAAFTAMRARGAEATDVVVLVVAADDGVMPQTKEAIDHARVANVPIVVAINKCDLANANPDKVKKDLQQEDLTSEEWGGKTVMVEVSAHTGEGVDDLVEMLMLESEMLELKANPRLRARGVVIEGKKTPGQGVTATLLVQNGTLCSGDIVLCGYYYGKIKAMINDVGQRIEKATPSTPIEVLGLQGVPEAGEEFFVVKDEKKAKTLSTLKQNERRTKNIAGSQSVTLEDLHSRILEGKMKELKIILKADVQGSVQALKNSLEELATDEVKFNAIHSAVGDINESDVMLAMVSNAIIIGFNVKIDTKADDLAKDKTIDVRLYDVIYEAIADVKAGMEGLLEPEEKEVFQGSAQIREVFSASKIGKAAGCMVTKGTIHRKDRIRIKRVKEIVYEGEINALKRFKDDVREVKEGFECGITLKNFNNIRKDDVIEAFIIEKIARRLEK